MDAREDPVERMMRAAFDNPTRTPTSQAYKDGCRAALAYRFEGASIKVPFPLGSAEADAFFAGADEGHRRFQEVDGEFQSACAFLGAYGMAVRKSRGSPRTATAAQFRLQVGRNGKILAGENYDVTREQIVALVRNLRTGGCHE